MFKDPEGTQLFSGPNLIPQDAVVSTKWHELTDEELRSTAARMSQHFNSDDPTQSSYISIIRQLSRHIEGLTGIHANKGGQTGGPLQTKKVPDLVNGLPPSEGGHVERILETSTHSVVDGEPSVRAPHLVSIHAMILGSPLTPSSWFPTLSLKQWPIHLLHLRCHQNQSSEFLARVRYQMQTRLQLHSPYIAAIMIQTTKRVSRVGVAVKAKNPSIDQYQE